MKWRRGLVAQDKLVKFMASDEITHRDKLIIILASVRVRPLPTAEILKIAKGAGLFEVERWNVYDILIKSRGMVAKVKEGWSLSSQGRAYVEQKYAQGAAARRTPVKKK
jgi:hypothetical protein